MKRGKSFYIFWIVMFVLINFIGFGIAGILMLFQGDLTKSMEEDEDNEEKQFAMIEELKESNQYDIYNWYTKTCDEEYREDVDRIVQEAGIEDYYVVEYEESYAIVDMSSVQYSCEIRGGAQYLLAEKQPLYVDEASGMPVLQCVAHADGYLGHPGPGIIMFALLAALIVGIIIITDVVWLVVLIVVLIVNFVKKKKQLKGGTNL